MDIREDPWWPVAVGLLIGLLIVAVLIPVCLIKPMVTPVEQLATSPTETDLSLARKPPGLALPILAIMAAVFLSGLSAWKIHDERESGSRWTWILVVAGMTLLWAILMLQITLSIGAQVVGAR